MDTRKCNPSGGWTRRDFVRTGLVGLGAWPMIAAGVAADPSAVAASGDFIDAHAHVWTSDSRRYPPVDRSLPKALVTASFTPEDLLSYARPCGVRRIVLIQYSYYGSDNRYLLDSMKRMPGVFSGVAVIDAAGHPREAMLALAAEGVRGFRLMPKGAPADRWLDDPQLAAMWRCGAEQGLAMCLLIDPQYLPAVARMCRRFPDTPVVIDHFARIGVDGEIRESDVARLGELASYKNVRVKLSAFYALGKKKAPYLDLAGMIRRLADRFGPERLMWATDSPFQVLGGHSYKDSLELIRQRLDFLSPGDRQWLLRKTAEKTFFT